MTIHASALVDPGARLGAGVTIGPYAVIEGDVVIGDGSEIRAHAVIKRFTSLGCSNVVYEGAVIGGEPQDLGFTPCESYVQIGDRNHLRENVTVHRGTRAGSTTIIGSDCFLMANAHVAHDCRLGDRVILANNVALAGHVDVGERAFLSGGVVVHQFCRVGRLAMIGGNAKIVQDCLPFVITDGVPGEASGLNLVGLRRAGLKADEVRNLKQAYRLILRSGLLLQEALSQAGQLDDANVRELIEFIRASKRGIARGVPQTVGSRGGQTQAE